MTNPRTRRRRSAGQELDGAEEVGEHPATVDVADHDRRRSRPASARPRLTRSPSIRLISAGLPAPSQDDHVEATPQIGQRIEHDAAQLGLGRLDSRPRRGPATAGP